MVTFVAYWNRVFSDHLERRKYKQRMESALIGLNAIRDSIPDPWWLVDEGVPANVS